MNKGKILTYNSTIGIVAPSSPSDEATINSKIEEFTSLGFQVKLGQHIFDKNNYLAGNDKDRANDINSMFIDNTVDGILCLRGGYGSSRIIKYLNKKAIKENPKFFCGYSDITLLLNYFSSKMNMLTFHGPMITSNFNDTLTKDYFLKTCCNNKSNFIYKLPTLSSNLSTYNTHSFTGKIMGGNLSLICSSIGTPYEVNTDNSILLIEEVNESPYTVDRMITQLINCGKFKNVQGILLGNFTNCSSIEDNICINDILLKLLLPLNIPLVFGVPFGHDYPNITLPIGATAYFNHCSNFLIIKDSFLI